MIKFHTLRRAGQGMPTLAVGVVWLFAACQSARVWGEPIVFSKPADGGFATNIYSLIAPEERRTIQDKLQERQLRAGQLLKPQLPVDSDFGPPPPGRIVVPNQGQRDQGKNWAFSLQEELDMKDPSAAEAMKFIDPDATGKPKRAETAEDRYVARLADGSDEVNVRDAGASRAASGEDGSTAKPVAGAAEGQSTAGSVLRSLLESGGAKGGISRLSGDKSALDRESAWSLATPSSQRSRMSDFRALLEAKSTVASALDKGPSSLARIAGLPGLSPSGNDPFGANGDASPGSSSWTKLLNSGQSQTTSLAPAPAPVPQAPTPLLPTSPLRMMGAPVPAFPPRR